MHEAPDAERSKSAALLTELYALGVAKCEKYNWNMLDTPTPALSIRDYRTNDAARLHGIDQACFPRDIAFSRSELLLHLNAPDAVSSIAEQDGDILGFALGRISNEGWARVVTLDVLPHMRRHGIGTRLMNSLHEKFKIKMATLSMLEVSTINTSAQRLYEVLGYRMVDILRGYYNGREDAYRMVCFF